MKKCLRQIWQVCSENFLAEQSRWMAWIPFLFGLGIGIYFLLPFEPNYWLSLGLLELLLLLFYLLRFRNLHLLFIILLTILAGFINIQMQSTYSAKRVAFAPQRTTYIRGRVADISYSSKGKERLLLVDAEDEENPLIGKYRITVTGRQHFRVNQCVELVATLFPPEPVPVLNGFQLNRKYFYDGLSAIGYANSEIFEIDCLQHYPSSTFKSRLNAVRKEITDDIAAILPEDEAGIVDAVLIGEQTRIPQNIHENYRDAGLAHFLSVSGLHLGAIAGLVFFVLRLLIVLIPGCAVRCDSKKFAAVGAILFSALYLLISGMAIPAERAFIMTSVVLVGIIFNRQAISMRMVSFAALVVLIIIPEALVSISFQMSFAAVVALIAFYERYAGTLAAWGRSRGMGTKVLMYLAGIVICDLVASLATTPFAIYHFHRVSVYTSLGNLLAGPLIGLLLMPLILLCLVALPLGMAFYPLKMLGFGIGILNRITDFVAGLPHSVAIIDSLPFYGFVLIIFGGCWLCIWQRPWRRWGIILIAAGIVPMFFAAEPDMVFARKAEGIAVRDNFGAMVLLPQKMDNFVKTVWKENLQLKELDKKQKKELKDIYAGKQDNLRWLDLQCDKGGCLYKERIHFSKHGDIRIDGKKIDNQAGWYIYLNRKQIKIRPLHNKKQNRLWQIH